MNVPQDGATRAGAPVHIVTGADGSARGGQAPTREVPWGVLGGLAGAAVCAIAVAAWLELRRRRSRAPGERAFLRMAGALRVDRRGREIVRGIAAECGVEPVALLVSPGAMREALARVDSDRWQGRRGWSRVASLAEAG